MKYIISGTDRPESNTKILSKYIESLYRAESEEVEIIDLNELSLDKMNGSHYGAFENYPNDIQAAIKKIDSSHGLIIVCPEYNGSLPGALKKFIDYLSYPDSFESRPVCFVGLGGRWGGLRPVEHLQQIFSYRNAYQFPERVFVSMVWSILKEGRIEDETIAGLLKKQTVGFIKYVNALRSASLSAGS